MVFVYRVGNKLVFMFWYFYGFYDFGDRFKMVIVLEFSFGFLCWRYFGSFVKSNK